MSSRSSGRTSRWRRGGGGTARRQRWCRGCGGSYLYLYGIDQVVHGGRNLLYGRTGPNRSAFEEGVYRVTGSETAAVIVPAIAAAGLGLAAVRVARVAARSAAATVAVAVEASGAKFVNVSHWQRHEIDRLLAAGRLTPREVDHFGQHIQTYFAGQFFVDGVNAPAAFRLPGGSVGATWIRGNGTPVVTLPRHTTGYFATHEYFHVLHFRQVESIYGPHAQSVWRSLSTRATEQAVFDAFRGMYWHRLTFEQQRHATWYIIHSGGHAW